MKLKKSEKANLEKKRSIFFQIGLVLAIGTVLIILEWRTSNAQKSLNDNIVDVDMEVELIPVTYPEKPKPPELKVKNPETFIISDNVNDGNEFDPTGMNFNLSDSLDITIRNWNIEPEDEPMEKDSVFEWVSQMPEFIGGQVALMRFIKENIDYPQDAVDGDIQGKVMVKFVIDEFGNVKDAEVVRSVDPLLDKEALRIVNSFPKWNPGVNGNKQVKVSVIIPINFILLDK